MTDKVFICIDLKSFYASVECVERGLDPFKTNLVVADPARGRGGICLAITPAMKDLGIHNRCRIFEIPKNVRYITALPRMKRYMEVSADIYGTYLNFVAPEDIHPYSIDEVFIDATNYLHIYRKNPKEMAVMLINAVMERTGICATAGIGTNLFLAKVALDITAKHVPDHIGYLDVPEFERTLWHHRPITDIWNIGRGIAFRLEKYGIYDLYGVAHCDERLLYKEFGVNAEFLIDHAHGREPCEIRDIQTYKSKTNSLSNSQILFSDYTFEDALICMKEMVDMLSLELIEKHMVASGIALGVGYSRDVAPSTGGSERLSEQTSSYDKLVKEFESIYRRTTRRTAPIRKLSIAFTNIVDEDHATLQPDLFSQRGEDEKERKMQEAVLAIKQKFGKNALLRGMSYTDKATARVRNKLIGGHNGGE